MGFAVRAVRLKTACLLQGQYTESSGPDKKPSCFHILHLIPCWREGRDKARRGKGFPAAPQLQHSPRKRQKWHLLSNLPSASVLKALSSSRTSARASSSSSSKHTILWPRNPPAPVTRQLTPARDMALACSSLVDLLSLELGSPPA